MEDDPYSLIPFSNHIDTSTLKSLDDGGNVLYVSSFSKIAASGLRIGWVVGPDNVIQRLADAKQQMDFGHSIFPQWIAAEYLASDSFTANLKNLKHKLVEKRNILTTVLQEVLSNELEFQIPHGGIHLWCRLRSHDINEYKLLEESIRNGVAFVPGSLLSSQTGYIRLTFGRVETHLIKEGILRLKKGMENITNTYT